jgi:hypothetical protein
MIGLLLKAVYRQIGFDAVEKPLFWFQLRLSRSIVKLKGRQIEVHENEFEPTESARIMVQNTHISCRKLQPGNPYAFSTNVDA